MSFQKDGYILIKLYPQSLRIVEFLSLLRCDVLALGRELVHLASDRVCVCVLGKVQNVRAEGPEVLGGPSFIFTYPQGVPMGITVGNFE